MAKRGLKRSVYFSTELVEEWASLGYNQEEIAADLGISVNSLQRYDNGAYSRGKKKYKADLIASIDLDVVEEMVSQRYTIAEITNELGVSQQLLYSVAKDAIARGRANKVPTMEVVDTAIPVHKPRYAPYNGKPCHRGHKARRIINTGNCAECHRLETKGGKLQEFIGRPRQRAAIYKGEVCQRCHTNARYASTGKCVNCQRQHSFSYSRKIGLGTLVGKRTTNSDKKVRKI